MPVSRRSFVAALGAGATGLIAGPLVTWRGHEELFASQGQPDRKADRLLASRPGMIRIDSNENPNGPGRRALDAITARLHQSNRYPVKEEDDLVATIAKVHGVKPENVLLGCGSGELLRAAVYAFTSPSRALVAPEPTFEAPGAFAKFLNHPVVAPRVDSKLQLDLDAMADAARGAGLVYFCNPNNPTATVHGGDAVAGYVNRVAQTSPDTTILIDEAYHEYVADPSYRTAVPIALANPRVVVTRTFSKVFGMAGLRAGYAIGQPDTLKKMGAWLLGSNMNQLVLAAAEVSLTDTAHIHDEVRRNAEARAYTRKFFEGLGYTVPAAEANFMMVDVRRDSKAFKMECVKHNVAIGRPFPAVPSYARVSVGTMPEMKKAVAVFRAVLSNQVSH
ncbi:MAG TPA: aminotransferase class I/II-fold pyridoxal phosphate-dependent enzyme [Gemmatimonadaceae bacterium]|nr:aminotransferase class I/II-fold pyridoxal phosphate-dependent enzyme [Gemmatimonadaceae bacterium]